MIVSTEDNVQYSGINIFDNIPLSSSDIYIVTSEGDRLDNLAYQFYGDASFWKVIVLANSNLVGRSLYLDANLQLRIPTDRNKFQSILSEINK
jgi:phage tail protein X